ncbi:hypothetical protein ACFL6S_17670 [Candidatus Poribacteria bacterium]
MKEMLACIGLLCASIGSASHGDLIEDRQNALLEMLQYVRVPQIAGSASAGQKYFTPRPWRSAYTKYTASLLNGVNVAEAAAWFKDDENLVISEWETLMLLRGYHALKGNEYFISSGAKEKVEEYLKRCVEATRTPGNKVNWKLDGYWGSENHKIVQFSERLLLEELAGEGMDESIHDQVAYQIKMWCREKALRGYTEYCSPHYTERSLVPLLNIYDYTIDEDLKKWVHMAIDQLMVECAIFQINGFRGGAIRRCYQSSDGGYPNAELNDGRYDCMHPVGYVFFDNTNLLPITYRASDQSIIYVFLATTAYRPTLIHNHLARPEKRGMLELKSGRRWDHEGSQPQAPDTYIYAWITPQYVLSSIRIPPEVKWEGAVNGGIPYRLSFHDCQAMIGTRASVGGTSRSAVAVAPDPESQRPLFQHQNVLIYRGTVDTYRHIEPVIPRGRGIDHKETEGEYRFYREKGVDGESVYSGVLERNGLGIMEVRLASQYPSWTAFMDDFRSNEAVMNSESDVNYTTCDGVQIRISGNKVTLDGVEQQLAGWPLYDSLVIKGDWLNQSNEAGLVTIGDEHIGTLTLDFRDENRPMRRLNLP